MNKKILLIIGIILIAVGCVVSYLTNYSVADITGFAVTMFGAGLAACTLYEKRDTSKKAWMPIAGIALIGAGAFILGFGGMAENTMTMIITSIIGLVAVISGILALSLSKKS